MPKIFHDLCKTLRPPSSTCLMYGPLKRKKDALLPHIYVNCPDSLFDSLPRFHDKIKVSL